MHENDKWRLAWEIVNQPAEERNLSSVDLSGVDLSGADLKFAKLNGADLSGANLGGANLNRANVKNARFAKNPGISLETKLDLIRRGAIFGIEV